MATDEPHPLTTTRVAILQIPFLKFEDRRKRTSAASFTRAPFSDHVEKAAASSATCEGASSLHKAGQPADPVYWQQRQRTGGPHPVTTTRVEILQIPFMKLQDSLTRTSAELFPRAPALDHVGKDAATSATSGGASSRHKAEQPTNRIYWQLRRRRGPCNREPCCNIAG